ncbi:hypothetical protein [uncultured Bilophila sp.]|uniref:hypothetical protein n=1 Tax=uncultured Bilophila sp. TaxID=529385 RepID=UPI00280AC13E|nr:hypothetical protein [uncultured Bilophila sp.]
MGKFKRISVKDINAMRKVLDGLPDKNLGKTREEAAELLNANILKEIEKMGRHAGHCAELPGSYRGHQCRRPHQNQHGQLR